jgi:hypothetical protein
VSEFKCRVIARICRSTSRHRAGREVSTETWLGIRLAKPGQFQPNAALDAAVRSPGSGYLVVICTFVNWVLPPHGSSGYGPWCDGMNLTVSPGTVGPYGIEFVTVPAGEFQMGQKDVGPGWDKVPVHRVIISKSFEMGIYEITQKQFGDVTGFNPSYEPKGNSLPVGMTSWDDAQAFIDALNSRGDGYAYRLPTEAGTIMATAITSCRVIAAPPIQASVVLVRSGDSAL